MPTQTKTCTQRHRDKIAASKVLPRLLDHFSGKIELSPTQVSVGLKLLNKITPDLKAVEVENSGQVDHSHSFDKKSLEQAKGAIREVLESVRARDSEGGS